MIYFTSDLHFCHDRGFIYEPRGFENVEEMNKTIVENWNNIIKKDDIVYILGDLILNDNAKGIHLLSTLNGQKKIILGNHDTQARIELYKALPNTEVIGYADMLKYNGYHFYLSHYPTVTSNVDDYEKPLKQRVLNLFGHTHDCRPFFHNHYTLYNVALDAHDNTPVSIEQIIEDIKDKKQKMEQIRF